MIKPKWWNPQSNKLKCSRVKSSIISLSVEATPTDYIDSVQLIWVFDYYPVCFLEFLASLYSTLFPFRQTMKEKTALHLYNKLATKMIWRERTEALAVS